MFFDLAEFVWKDMKPLEVVMQVWEERFVHVCCSKSGGANGYEQGRPWLQTRSPVQKCYMNQTAEAKSNCRCDVCAAHLPSALGGSPSSRGSCFRQQR